MIQGGSPIAELFVGLDVIVIEIVQFLRVSFGVLGWVVLCGCGLS